MRLIPVALGPEEEPKDNKEMVEYFKEHVDEAIAWNLACLCQRLDIWLQMEQQKNKPVIQINPKNLRTN